MQKRTMTLTPERDSELRIPGNLKYLEKRIYREIDIPVSDLIKNMGLYILELTEKQKLIFRSYYLMQMSVYEIRYHYGFCSFTDVERTLESATKKYIKTIKWYKNKFK